METPDSTQPETADPKNSPTPVVIADPADKTGDDHLDCLAVDHARAAARQGGKKPMGWAEFKKKLGR